MLTAEQNQKVQSAMSKELAHLGRVKTLLEIENDELKKKVKHLERLVNVSEVHLLQAFAHALQCEDAMGWTTGQMIRDYLFRREL